MRICGEIQPKSNAFHDGDLANAGSRAPWPASRLGGIVLAGLRASTEGFQAFLARDLAAADDPGLEVIRDDLHLAPLQGGAWRERGGAIAELGLGHPVATLVG